ncbi:hypothetical protein N181_01910 [Sinorhizobium fredii USDA 205]|nr:hypothetical protein N181_01910 [Sinorhizobium fredii USDA 205]
MRSFFAFMVPRFAHTPFGFRRRRFGGTRKLGIFAGFGAYTDGDQVSSINAR